MLHKWSYGGDKGLYEVKPTFGGNPMTAVLRNHPDDVIGWVPLEKAVKVAHMVMGKNKQEFRKAADKAA